MLRTQYSWQLPTAVCMNTEALHGLFCPQQAMGHNGELSASGTYLC